MQSVERETILGVEKNTAVYVESNIERGTIDLGIQNNALPFISLSLATQNVTKLIAVLKEAIEKQTKMDQKDGDRRVIESFWLIYQNSRGEQKERIEAASMEEAGIKVKTLRGKILNYDETAHDFELYRQEITLERVKPSPENWIP